MYHYYPIAIIATVMVVLSFSSSFQFFWCCSALMTSGTPPSSSSSSQSPPPPAVAVDCELTEIQRVHEIRRNRSNRRQFPLPLADDIRVQWDERTAPPAPQKQTSSSPAHAGLLMESSSSTITTNTIASKTNETLPTTAKSKHLQRKSSRASDKTRMKKKSTKNTKRETTGAFRSRSADNIRRNGMEIPYEDTFTALRVFHKHHGHVILPRRYVVPSSLPPPQTTTASLTATDHTNGTGSVIVEQGQQDENDDDYAQYPKIWHGVDLAGTVYNIRWWQKHIKHRPDRVAELNTLAFVWERLQPEWNLILEALIVYRSIYGNLLVKSNFVVPYDDDKWPKACWGLALGTSVQKIRNRGDYLRDHHSWERREQLDSIGFIWDRQEVRFNKFCHALRIYRQIHGVDGVSDVDHLLKKKNIKILMDESTSLARFSSSSSNLIGSDNMYGAPAAADCGFGFTTDSGGGGAPVTPLRVPTNFRVPRSSLWPNSLWGYPLGERCTQVRQKKLYIKDNPKRIQQLVDIGLVVDTTTTTKIQGGNNDLSWLKVVHAAAVYSQLHNNILDVPNDFVVPSLPGKKQKQASDDAWPWPEYLWGFPLGRRLRDVRVKGYHLSGDNANERRRQLDALGMIWRRKRGPRPRPKQ